MRKGLSLLLASVVAAFVFAIAWIRLPVSPSNLRMVFATLVGYGIVIVILSLTIGYLLASIAARFRLIRWWSSTAVGVVVGALLGGFFTYHHSPSSTVAGVENLDSQSQIIENPFAVTFSPWNRDAPGFVDNIPLSQTDFVGSAVFGAIVGGVLGLAFWYFYSRPVRPSSIA